MSVHQRVVASVLGLGVACASPSPMDGGAADSDVPASDTDVTWHRDVRPIVDVACLSCHAEGGVGPVVLTVDLGATEAPAWAATVTASVAAGRMPPWHASDDCHPIQGSRSLPDADRAVFAAWAAGGFALGDPSTYVAPSSEDAGETQGPADRVLQAEAPYTPHLDRPDEYHCLPVGDAVASETWLSGVGVAPDVVEMVHHAIVFRVRAADAAKVDALDAAAPGVGYPCFGGPAGDGAFGADNLYTYLPGNTGDHLGPDEGRVLEAGDRLVMQVHYNTLPYSVARPVPSDQTAVQLWVRDTVPAYEVQTVGLNVFDLDIPAGAVGGSASETFAYGVSADLVSTMPHMHLLGRSLKVEAVSERGRRCLVDVPDWDFDWQQTYRFPDAQPFTLEADETLELTCVYDNAAADQPVVDGVQLDPRDVAWGEGTLDEMCLAYVHVRLPTGAALSCDAFDTLLAACSDDDGDCWVDGLDDVVRTCGGCVVEGLGACRDAACGTAFAPLGACLQACDDAQLACLQGDCAEQTADYLACLGPEVREGTCDGDLAACGIGPYGP